MAGAVTGAKTKFLIGAVHDPDDNTLSEFDALTGMTEVGEITNFSEFGASYQTISSNVIGAPAVKKYKGQRDDGELTLTLDRVPSDTGQAALRMALDNTLEDYVFKVELGDKPSGASAKPTRFYIVGKVMSYTTNPGGANNMVTATVRIAINGAIVEGAAAAS